MIFQNSPEILNVTLLVLPDASLMSIAATLDPMRAANRIAARTVYRWRIVSMDGTPPLTTSGLPIAVDGIFDPSARQEALIVIGAFHIFHHATARLLRGVREAARNSAAIGGIEAGAWVLALAGLLDGRRATTHWEDLEEFAARFSQVDVQPDRYVIDGPVFTTGGATPALDLMLALIRARQGSSTALDVASIFIYEEVKVASDAQPVVSLGIIDRHEPRVGAAIKIMETHLDRPLSIAAIARRIQVSTRTLEVLFQRTVHVSPGAYYLSLRLKAAHRLIVDARLSVADTAERTGFSSTASLSRAFKRRFGHPPTVARRKAS